MSSSTQQADASIPTEASRRGAGGRKRVNASPEGDQETTQPSGSKKKKRALVRVACSECRRRRIRCDGERPKCGCCISHGLSEQCEYDTKDVAESRTAALKRENDEMRSTLDSLAQAFEHIRDIPRLDALRLLDGARQTADPVATLASLGRVPISDLATATSATVQSQTGMEFELNVLYSAAYHSGEAVDETALDASLAGSHFWRASSSWRAAKESVNAPEGTQ